MAISNIFRTFTPMKEQVTDISKILQNMAEETRSMRETIDRQYAQIAKLNRNIESLNHQLRKKGEEITELRVRLSKYESPDKNSGNSSTPPSKERMKDEIVRRTKTLRKPSGKKPGGQHGHEGHKLSCIATPDEVVDDIPNYCTNCGETLADAERVLDHVTQVISMPELKPVVKGIRHYVMVCKNCGERIRTAPRRRSNDVVYDASVKSLVVYLSVVQFLPYGRISSFLHDVLGLSPSEGSLVNWVNEAKKNARPVVDKIKECIMSSSVVGFDESGCYCNKKLDWAWIAQTVYYTLLFRADRQRLQGLDRTVWRQPEAHDRRDRPSQCVLRPAFPKPSGLPCAPAPGVAISLGIESQSGMVWTGGGPVSRSHP